MINSPNICLRRFIFIPLPERMKSLSVADILLLHNTFKIEIESNPEFENKNKRLLYFLAACSLFDSELDLPIALKLRPHGGLIGIDDSSLDTVLKHSKVFRLHAILHDAAGFVKDYNSKGPGYIYAFGSGSLNSCILGHLSGLIFCLYLKLFRSKTFRMLEC